MGEIERQTPSSAVVGCNAASRLGVRQACRCDLWRKLDALPSLDPRIRKNSGFAPSATIAPLVFTLTSGGSSLAEPQHRWQGERSYFYVDSGSSGARYVNAIDLAGFTRWGISYHKWTEKLEQLAAALPESAWSAAASRRPRTPSDRIAGRRRSFATVGATSPTSARAEAPAADFFQ